MTNTIHTQRLHRRRMKAERRFRFYGKAALWLAMLALVVLVGSILARGVGGFVTTEIQLEIHYSPQLLGIDNVGEIADVPTGTYFRLIQQALKHRFPNVQARPEQRELYGLVSMGATRTIQLYLERHPGALGESALVWVPASSRVDMGVKGRIDRAAPEAERSLSDRQFEWLDALEAGNDIRTAFNSRFFTHADSRQPELAGFLGAISGSLFTLMACLALAFPLGVMTAVYLEEFSRRNIWTDVIEVNINNLAAVPSIVFGLLGLSLYINVMGMPRSAPLVGGFTLALMILPVIIISTRTSLQAVPDSIRQAALALGATKLQTVWHHTLPLAMPGIMTGTILGLARAIGETAPLLMIGMVAFIADVPGSMTDPATVMPVQIYLWASSPEAGFVEKTAAGILVLLMILVSMNALAIYLRKKFEVRW